ncbi:MAG TPA: DUF4175 family protein, partial [Thermopetrobacter sp.]|nr:DUF4175 family protein [Thermopetrobacter sp.]
MPAREESNAARRLARRVAFAVWRARLSLLWERLWPALWPLAMVAGTALLCLLAGLPLILPTWMRLPLLAAFAVAALWAARDLRAVGMPTRAEALRRVEAASGLSHHPLLSLEDAPVAPREPRTRRIWQAHVRRLAAAVGRLRAGPPRSRVARRDPYALRFALLLGIVTLL